jgi:pyridoxamine 5'-phosphate oxidase
MDSLKQHTDYGSNALLESHLPADPIDGFTLWLKDAEAAGIYEPNAFVLGTVDSMGAPNARTVLLKGLQGNKFFFASNYNSRKGQEIGKGGAVSMVFGWYAMHRQVIVQGFASKSSAESSEEYFQSRPHDSQVASFVSQQSQPIESRTKLEEAYESALSEFRGKQVPTPLHWGGYLIEPTRIEFWQGRTSRMHDRISFTRESTESKWQVQRLQP